MVTQTERLKAQRQRQLASRRRQSQRRLQQESLRTGQPISQILVGTQKPEVPKKETEKKPEQKVEEKPSTFEEAKEAFTKIAKKEFGFARSAGSFENILAQTDVASLERVLSKLPKDQRRFFPDPKQLRQQNIAQNKQKYDQLKKIAEEARARRKELLKESSEKNNRTFLERANIEGAKASEAERLLRKIEEGRGGFSIGQATESIKQTEIATRRTQKARTNVKETQEALSKVGINLKDLQKGKVTIQDLSAKQQDALVKQGLIERTTGVIAGADEGVVRQYEKAGFSRNQAEILAKESELRGQSISPSEAQIILRQSSATPAIQSSSLSPSGGIFTAQGEQIGSSLEVVTLPERTQKIDFGFQKSFPFIEVKERTVELTPKQTNIVKKIEDVKGGGRDIVSKGFGFAGTVFEKTAPEEVKLFRDVISENQRGIQNKIQGIQNKKNFLLFSPEQKNIQKNLDKASEEANKAVENINPKVEDFNRRVEEFNLKVNTGQISAEQAEKMKIKLEKEAENLQKEQSRAENKINKVNKLVDKAKKAEPEGVTRLSVGFVEGATSLPFDLASLGIKTVSEPEQTFFDIASLPKTLPESFAEDPLGSGGELIGGTIAATGLLRAASKAKSSLRGASGRANKINKVRKIKTDVAIDVEVSNAIKIGDDLFGNSQFKVNSKVTTRLLNRKTGRTIEKVETEVVSDVVTAFDEAGAIRAVSEGVAESLRRGGIRKYKKKPKVTIRKDLKKAKTEAVLRPTEADDIFKGKFETEIFDEGIKRGKSEPLFSERFNFGDLIISKDVIKKIKTRTPTKSSGLGEIVVKKGKPRKTTKKVGDVKIEGFESLDLSKTIADLSKDTFRVKGFKRRVPRRKIKILGKEIPVAKRSFSELLTGRKKQRIKAQTRRFPTEQKPLRDFSLNIERTFIPKKAKVNLKDFDFKSSGKKGRIQKKKKAGKQNFQEQILGQRQLTKKAAAKEIARAEASQVGLTIGKELKTKAAKAQARKQARAIKKQQQRLIGRNKQLSKVSALTSTTTKQLSSQKQTQKQRQQQKQLSKVLGVASLQSPAFSLKLSDLTKTKSLQKLNQIQKTPLISPPRITPGTKTGLITSPDIISPKTPKIPKLFRFPKKKRGRLFDKDANKPHHVYIRERGKLKRITKKPVPTKQEALNTGAYLTDHSLSADFRVKPSKAKPKPFDFNIPTGYFNFYGDKFRTFRKRGKRKIPVKNTFIEKQSRRLDTPEEVRRITVTRLINQRTRKARQKSKVSNELDKIFGFPGINKKVTKGKRKIKRKRTQKKLIDFNKVMGVDKSLNLI